MKKTWNNPSVEELNITATANGMAPANNFDDVWVSLDGKWYIPGNGSLSSSEN